MKIVLACAAGLSTSMLMDKMREAAEKRGIDLEIGAYPVSELDVQAPGSDIILLGPQVSYQKAKVAATYPTIPVEVVDMLDYGMMNGAKVLEHVLNVIKK